MIGGVGAGLAGRAHQSAQQQGTYEIYQAQQESC
jgi:hypothetical protein